MKLPPIEYASARSVEDAVAILTTNEDAKPIAGGQSLIPLMALRLARPTLLVDLREISDLSRLTVDNSGAAVIGAMVTHRQLETNPRLRNALPLVCKTMSLVGHPQIRNRGTIGGSLVHNDPAAEWPALALLLDADIEVAGPAGGRMIAAREWSAGAYSAAINGDEIATAVHVPSFMGWSGGVSEAALRHGDFALVGALALAREVDSIVVELRLAVFGLTSAPLRLAVVEERAVGGSACEILSVVAEAVGGIADVVDDVYADGDVRRHVAMSVIERALRMSLGGVRD